MDKKYQIFISSTYVDLKDERQAVSKAILDLGHIPSGMELFPAANASQLDYIRKVIDDCDYYVVLLGGRYGSLDEDGLSYTEKEYNYAVSREIPILAFVHRDIGNLRARDTETDSTRVAKLSTFRERLTSGRLVKFWSNISDLQASVITSLTSEFRENPRIGWRRDTGEIQPEVQRKLSAANDRVSHWYKRAIDAEGKVKSYENLSETEVEVRFVGQDGPASARLSGEQIIREFAVPLSLQLEHEDIPTHLLDLIRHTIDPSAKSIDRSAAHRVELFLRVFEIAEVDQSESRSLRIKEGKKHLLMAAFRPLTKVLRDHDDDEIPW